MSKKYSIVLLMSVVVVCLFVRDAYSGKTPSVFLTADIKEKILTSEFDCRGKIYLYALFRDIKAGSHGAEAVWKNPQGQLQQGSSPEFKTNGKPYAVWLWLKLIPSTGGELFGDIDPSFGMGEFFGRWKAELYLDNEFIDGQIFYVAC